MYVCMLPALRQGLNQVSEFPPSSTQPIFSLLPRNSLLEWASEASELLSFLPSFTSTEGRTDADADGPPRLISTPYPSSSWESSPKAAARLSYFVPKKQKSRKSLNLAGAFLERRSLEVISRRQYLHLHSLGLKCREKESEREKEKEIGRRLVVMSAPHKLQWSQQSLRSEVMWKSRLNTLPAFPSQKSKITFRLLNVSINLNCAPEVGLQNWPSASTFGRDDSEASSSQIAGDRTRTRTDAYLDAPWVGGLVERVLHDLTDNLTLGEDLGEVLGAQHIPEGGRRQQPSRVTEYKTGRKGVVRGGSRNSNSFFLPNL